MSFFLPFTNRDRGPAWSFVGLASSFPDLSPNDPAPDLASPRLFRQGGEGGGGGGGGNSGGEGDGDLVGASSSAPGCRVYNIPRSHNTPYPAEISLGQAAGQPLIAGDEPGENQEREEQHQQHEQGSLKNQVLVFRYRGKFYAVDHECPHSSYPLSRGAPFDIEDFGVVFGAGIACPKHGWSFDLFSGRADRGTYKLAVWEVQLRDRQSGMAAAAAAAAAAIASTNGGSKGGGNEGAAAQEKTGEKEVWVRRRPKIG